MALYSAELMEANILREGNAKGIIMPAQFLKLHGLKNIVMIAVERLGSEINKTRPCMVISPNGANKYLKTVVITPITFTLRKFPMRRDVILKRKRVKLPLTTYNVATNCDYQIK